MTRRRCRDCPEDSRRPAPHAGPRCATHHREMRHRRRATAHARHIWETYRLTPEQYQAILAKQGGVCAGCRRAKGIRKKLSVDHDHKCCDLTPTCGRCTRGLLCTKCNSILGWYRDDPVLIRGMAEYLEDPPAREVLVA